MLYAAFSTLMNFAELEHLSEMSGRGRYGTRLENFGTHVVRGWSFGYFADTSAWNSNAVADIVEDPKDSINVLVVDMPTRMLNVVCERNLIYSGYYRFDFLNIDSLGREAIVIRLAKSMDYAKPNITTVLRLIEYALNENFKKRYIDDVIIGRAKLDRKDKEYLFSEEMYSKTTVSVQYLRDWFTKHK